MIVFKRLRWKNFLSTGNNWIDVDFRKDPTTLVIGQNGAGKSTMLDALAYALFGKAHRNIKNAQLINSINKKGTTVEVMCDFLLPTHPHAFFLLAPPYFRSTFFLRMVIMNEHC